MGQIIKNLAVVPKHTLLKITGSLWLIAAFMLTYRAASWVWALTAGELAIGVDMHNCKNSTKQKNN